MRTLKVMNSKEKKQIFSLLEEQYGFSEKLDYVFLLDEKEDKIFIIGREAYDLAEINMKLNSLGLYFGQIYKEKLRLSIEASQIIGKQANKNILELNEEQRNEWLKGEDLKIEADDNFYLIKSGDDFIGTGKLTNNHLSNFIPKARRISDVS